MTTHSERRFDELDKESQLRLQNEPPNFESDGKLYLVKCKRCGVENYGPMVASGECAWCGWYVNNDV
jgi:hypothetical protein